VAKVFDITIDKAKETLSKTTQMTIRQGVNPITRRYKTFGLDPNQLRLPGEWTIDFLKASVKSIRQNIGAFVITSSGFPYVFCAPRETDEYSTRAITEFSNDVGVPNNLKSDLHPSFTGKWTKFQEYLRKHHIVMKNSESGRHGHTYEVDTAIRELRRRSRRKMISKNIPRRLWCFMLEWQARIMQIIPQGFNQRTAYEMVTGRTPDISEYCDFDFYDLVWYWPNTVEPHNDKNRRLARWVGVAHRIGSTMCYWLIPESGIVIANTSVQHVIADDYLQPAIKLQIDRFDAALIERLDDANFMLDPGNINPIDTYDDSNIITDHKFDDDISIFKEESDKTKDIDTLMRPC
jgi:hypothetical protein